MIFGSDRPACIARELSKIHEEFIRGTLEEIRNLMEDQIAPHKLPDELCIMDDFPRLSGGVKIKKFGQGGLAELAVKDETRQKIRKA